MDSREVIDAMLFTRNMTQAKLAEKLGWAPMKLNRKLVNNTLKADEFLDILDLLDVQVEFIDKQNGRQIRTHTEGYGEPVKGISDGIHFDTTKAEPIANNFWEDGEHEYGPDGTALELYVDKKGNYFFAEYSEDKKNRVRTATPSVAAAFTEKYGINLHREKKPET